MHASLIRREADRKGNFEMRDYKQRYLRPSRRADLQSIADLIWRTMDSSYTGIYPPKAIEYFKKHSSLQVITERQRDGYMVVVEVEDRIIATGTLKDGRISAVYVNPDFQHTGCGRLIMRALEEKAISQGQESIGLEVSLPSRAFYEKLGYRITEDCFVDVGNGETLNYWKANKALPRTIEKEQKSNVSDELHRG